MNNSCELDQNQEIVAIKRIIVESVEEANKAIQELVRVKDLKSENIATYLDLFIDKHDGLEIVCIVMEYYMGDLEQLIKEKKQFSEKQVKSYLKQIASAVKLMHDRGIMHRDLKPLNIFCKEMENGEIVLKVGDFGLTAYFSEFSLRSTFCGSPFYIAPELMSGKYSNKVDIFSLGVIANKLCTGKDRMFYMQLLSKKDETIEEVKTELEKLSYSGKFIFFILKLLSVNPDDRPDATEIIRFLNDDPKSVIKNEYEKKSRQRVTSLLASHVYSLKPKAIPHSPNSEIMSEFILPRKKSKNKKSQIENDDFSYESDESDSNNDKKAIGNLSEPTKKEASTNLFHNISPYQAKQQRIELDYDPNEYNQNLIDSSSYNNNNVKAKTEQSYESQRNSMFSSVRIPSRRQVHFNSKNVNNRKTSRGRSKKEKVKNKIRKRK